MTLTSIFIHPSLSIIPDRQVEPDICEIIGIVKLFFIVVCSLRHFGGGDAKFGWQKNSFDQKNPALLNKCSNSFEYFLGNNKDAIVCYVPEWTCFRILAGQVRPS